MSIRTIFSIFFLCIDFDRCDGNIGSGWFIELVRIKCNLLEIEPKHKSMLWKEANAEYNYECNHCEGNFSSRLNLKENKVRQHMYTYYDLKLVSKEYIL